MSAPYLGNIFLNGDILDSEGTSALSPYIIFFHLIEILTSS